MAGFFRLRPRVQYDYATLTVAHLCHAPIVSHVVVDAAPGNPAQRLETACVGVEQHLVILHALAVPGEVEERWCELLNTDGIPNDHEIPSVDIDPAELAQLLAERGIQTNFLQV